MSTEKFKMVRTIDEKIFTLLRKKNNITNIAKRLSKSRRTIQNHVKHLQNLGLLTIKKNATKKGIQFFHDFSYTQYNKKGKIINKVHVHKFQVYCKIVKAKKDWVNRRESFFGLTQVKSWVWNNSSISQFYVNDVRVRVTTKKFIFFFTDLKAESIIQAKEGVFDLLFKIKDLMEKRFGVVLSSNFFVTEQEIASQADVIAQVFNSASKQKVLEADGRFVLEIFDGKGEKRAHVDVSELDEFETVHSRHAEADMSGYFKHLDDSKRNNLSKQFKDWMFRSPPTLSYQFKKLKEAAARIEAQDLVIKKVEESTTRISEGMFVLSEVIEKVEEAAIKSSETMSVLSKVIEMLAKERRK